MTLVISIINFFFLIVDSTYRNKSSQFLMTIVDVDSSIYFSTPTFTPILI